MTILLIGSQHDANVDGLAQVARWLGYKFIVINPYDVEGSRICVTNSSRCDAIIEDGLGNSTVLSDVTGIWWRDAALQSPFPNGSAGNLRFWEWRYLLTYICDEATPVWMNAPTAMLSSNNRLTQMKRARDLGFCVPETLVTNLPEVAAQFVARLDEVVTKRISGGSYRENADRVLFTQLIGSGDVSKLHHISVCPTLFQERVLKEVELRVTIVGEDVYAAAIDPNGSAAMAADSRLWQLTPERYFRYELDSSTAERVKRLVRSFGLSYAAVDLIKTPDGRIVFLDLNCSGQWGYIEAATGYPISEQIIEMLATTGRS